MLVTLGVMQQIRTVDEGRKYHGNIGCCVKKQSFSVAGHGIIQFIKKLTKKNSLRMKKL